MSVASLCKDSVWVEDLHVTKTPQGAVSKSSWTRRAGDPLKTHSDQLAYHASLKYFSDVRDGAERNIEYRLFFFAVNPNLTEEITSLVDEHGRRFVVRDVQFPRRHHYEVVGSSMEGSA